jgi:peptide methionine sulfoxide reductase MsrB
MGREENEKIQEEAANEWAVKIVRVANGWKVEADEEEGHKEYVFQEGSEDEDGERVCFNECLRFVADYFGQIGSKHDKKRIVIGYTDKWAKIQDLLFP